MTWIRFNGTVYKVGRTQSKKHTYATVRCMGFSPVDGWEVIWMGRVVLPHPAIAEDGILIAEELPKLINSAWVMHKRAS